VIEEIETRINQQAQGQGVVQASPEVNQAEADRQQLSGAIGGI
jgi:hypothetical protein